MEANPKPLRLGPGFEHGCAFLVGTCAPASAFYALNLAC